jgi:osmotically-inducible protein OsmY
MTLQSLTRLIRPELSIMKRPVYALLSLSLAWIWGCAQLTDSGSTAGSEETTSKASTTGESQRGPSDAAITSSIKEAFRKDDLLGSLSIDVKTEKGVVTLSGSVPDALAYNRAISVARGVPGVRPPVKAVDLAYPQ